MFVHCILHDSPSLPPLSEYTNSNIITVKKKNLKHSNIEVSGTKIRELINEKDQVNFLMRLKYFFKKIIIFFLNIQLHIGNQHTELQSKGQIKTSAF